MAPPFIACTVIGMSPCAVMKMIGSLPVRGGKLALKLETASPRHSHIDHQAGRAIRSRIGLKKSETDENC